MLTGPVISICNLACKLHFKSTRAWITRYGLLTSEITPIPKAKQTSFFFSATVIISDFCPPRPNIDGILTAWYVCSKAEVERKRSPKWGVGGKGANPLTGFRCSCCHQWPVGGFKAAHCDTANLGPQAAQELESEGSHDSTATDEASAQIAILNQTEADLPAPPGNRYTDQPQH